MGTSSESVSFRLSPQFARQLEAEAEKRGMSRGDYARQIVIDGISKRHQEELLTEIGELRENLQRLADCLLQGQQELSASDDHIANLLKQGFTLSGSDSEKVGAAISEVDENVTKAREDLATGLTALLVYACGWELDEAMKWLDAKLINK